MTTIDPEKQVRAKQYGRIRRRLWLVDTIFNTIIFLAWLLFGWSVSLREWVMTITTNEWLVVILYIVIFGGTFSLISFPLNFYSGFILPHRFDQSNQTLKDWVIDQIKALIIGGVIGLILLELLYLALRLTGDLWWLWAAAGLLLFNVIFSNLAPIILMPLFNKFVPLGDEHKDLEERLLNLAKRAHTSVKGVFKFDMSKRTKSANAALAGMGNTRRIILGDTLIDEFTPDEIETVLAHELGHHVNRDIPVLIASGTFLTAVGLFIASRALDFAVSYFSFTSTADIAAFPALMLIISLYGLVTSPVGNALSRWRENMADDYALQSTGKKEAFASAFTRLANQNLGEIDPEKWVVFMFYSHPPLGERIAKANKYLAN